MDTLTRPTTAAPTSTPRRIRASTGAAERVALVAALAPTVVMVVRAMTSGWMPLFDAAYFTVRSRDVLTTHNPRVGAWSMGSREIGVWVNNLGPLQLNLLAPFTKLDAYWGTALGVGLTNIAAIAGVWFVAKHLFGPLGVVGAMAATVLVQLNEGSLMLIEARQQLAMVLPLWCLLWLAAAMGRGVRWATPWLVVVASLILQTHFTYAYQTIAIAVSAMVLLLVRHRTSLGALVRPGLAGTIVGAVLWALPLWDQFFGAGNMSRVLDQSGGSARSVGAARGLRILAESAYVPPFFTPGSMGALLREGARSSLITALFALAVWTALLVAVVVTMRRRHGALAAMGAVAMVALAASAYAVTKIPPTEQFGIIAQNYYWVWPIAIFCGTAVIGSVLQAITTWPGVRPERRFGAATAALAGAVVLAMLPLLRPTNELPETDHEWSVSRLQARPLMDQFGDSLDDIDFEGPVLIDLGSVRHVRYTLLTELQERDVDFRFGAGGTDLSRFGRERCDDGTAGYLITLRGGPAAILVDSPDTLLASVPGVTQEQAARSAELAREFAEAIRNGTVTVDAGGIEFLGGQMPGAVERIRNSPASSARGLSTFLTDWRNLDQVVVADNLIGELREWQQLEVAAANDRMAIYLTRIPPNRENRCGSIDPGDGFVSPG